MFPQCAEAQQKDSRPDRAGREGSSQPTCTFEKWICESDDDQPDAPAREQDCGHDQDDVRFHTDTRGTCTIQ